MVEVDRAIRRLEALKLKLVACCRPSRHREGCRLHQHQRLGRQDHHRVPRQTQPARSRSPTTCARPQRHRRSARRRAWSPQPCRSDRASHRQLPDGVSVEQRQVVEADLVAKAARFSPDQLRRVARRAIEAVEPDQNVVDAHENELIRSEEQAARDEVLIDACTTTATAPPRTLHVPALAAAILAKILDTMTAPRRMREPLQHRPAEDRSFDWRHRRGLAFAELLEHLPTDHLHPKTAATVVVTIDHTVLPAPSRQPTSTPTRPSPPVKPGASPATPRSSPPSSAASPSPSTSATQPGSSPNPKSGERARTHHLRRHRLRTPLRLVRAPPPKSVGARRQDRSEERDPAMPSTPSMDPRHRLQPPVHARRQRQVQPAHVTWNRLHQSVPGTAPNHDHLDGGLQAIPCPDRAAGPRRGGGP